MPASSHARKKGVQSIDVRRSSTATRRNGGARDRRAPAPGPKDQRERRWRAPRRGSQACSDRCARVIFGACHNRRRSTRSAARAGCPNQARSNADRAARVEHVDHRTLIGRVDPQRRVRLAGGRAADEQRRLQVRPLHLPATVTISSSDGVISPERPIMSARLSLAASGCPATAPSRRGR